MFTWKLTLEYEGTRYSGWQEQKHARTIAGEVKQAAEAILSKPIDLAGAGRTDAGVHALGQVARLRTASRAKSIEVHRALNDRLPPDINVLKVEQAQSRFDPRRDALARYYIYQISTRRTAFAKRFVWWVKDSLEFELMIEACEMLKGRHDFSSFCDKRSEDRSTIVVVNHIEIVKEGDLILLRIGASHFLWKMVRRIVGALVEVGRGSLEVSEFKNLLDADSATKQRGPFHPASHTAPPSGLFLERVVYDASETLPALSAAFPVTHFKS